MRSEEEFADLLMKSQERLFAYIYALLRNSEDTQDVLQQTACRLWEKFETFDVNTDDRYGDFFRWAATMAKYDALNFLRYRRAHRARFASSFIDGPLHDELLLVSELEEDRRRALSACINKLSESDRKMLRSRYNSGLQVTQIADLLGRSSSSVSNSLRRIRQALLRCIESTVERENRHE